jgi:hypothetical protein
VPLNERGIAAVAQLIRIRRLVADEFKAGDATALLIDGDDRLDVTEFAKVIDELPQLRGSLDVAAKKNESARLDAPECGGRLCIEFGAGDAGHEELAE